MRNWIDLLENFAYETLWVNARTGEIIDVAPDAIHHLEYALDNPEQLNIRTSSSAYRNALDLEYEDLIGNKALTREILKAHWTRCNYGGGWLNIDALSEHDVLNACLALISAGKPITTLCWDIRGQYQTLKGQELKDFLS